MKTEHPTLSSHRSSAEACHCEDRSDAAIQLAPSQPCHCEERSDAAIQLNRLRALRAHAVFPSLVALALVSFAPLPALALEITLPVEKVRLADSPLPGAALAVTMCSTCHSAEYVLYQPPTSPRTYWKATVVKMQKVFGAPIPDSAVDPITDYLVKLYGVDQPSSPAPPNTIPAQPAK
jgi:sulfite dehydrogenase